MMTRCEECGALWNCRQWCIYYIDWTTSSSDSEEEEEVNQKPFVCPLSSCEKTRRHNGQKCLQKDEVERNKVRMDRIFAALDVCEFCKTSAHHDGKHSSKCVNSAASKQ